MYIFISDKWKNSKKYVHEFKLYLMVSNCHPFE